MKIRSGFVSNSSSTSFCIYGIGICNPDKDARDKIINAEYVSDITVRIPPYEDIYYVGVPVGRMLENETKLQFENRCRELIIQYIGSEFAPQATWIIDGWYDA